MLERGSVFAGHRIEGVAGKGGMGVVYRATHLALDHVVALKVISPDLAQDARFRRRFAEESRIAVSIRHPNVVPIHHAGEDEGLLFVTMDLIGGSDLRGVLRAQGPLDPAHAAAIVTEVAAALDAAHSRGLVHRDIKPGNILIEGSGPDERVYLTDFGLARQVDASTGVTATGAFVGTLDYVAPEQIRGERVDARADVYALGCVLFELLTGNPPFAARDDKVAKMYAHLEEEPASLRVLRPELPGDLDLALRRALAKDPAERFPSAGDFARAVSAAVRGEPTVEAERSVAVGAAAPGPADATTTAERLRAGDSERLAGASANGGAVTVPIDEPTRFSGRALMIAGGVAGLVAVVVAVALIASGGGEEPASPSSAPAGGAAANGSGAPAGANATIEERCVGVGTLPVNLAHGQEALWVTNRDGLSVSEVDGDPAKEVSQLDLGVKPEGIAVGDGSIWVSTLGRGELLRLDPEGNEIARLPIGGVGGEVEFGKGAIWATNNGGDTLLEVDPGSNTVADTITVGANPYGIAVGDGGVWVSNRGDGTIQRVNPQNGHPEDPIPVGPNPKGIAIANGAEWVANADSDTVSRIDQGSEHKIDVGMEPRGVVAAFGDVWVSVGGADQVVRIDPESGDVVQRLDVGHGPESITAGPRSIWVANGIDGTLTRIGP
jgi:YVTN family beta-propeller protein